MAETTLLQFLHPRYWFSWLGLLLVSITIYFPVSIQLKLGKLISLIISPLVKKRFAIARRNLELCYPELSEQQREDLIEKLNFSVGMMPIETALSWWASDSQLRKRVTYEGLEHLDAALEKGKGVILLTGHFTSMELGGRLIMLRTPCHVMFREMNNKLFNAVMMRARIKHSEGIVLQKDPRTMVRALRKNKVIWYAPDQDFGPKPSIFAKFFGVTAATIPATSRLVKMSGAAVIPFVPRRDENGHYTLTLGKALDNFPTGDELADAQRINDVIEQEIRQSPEQYFWVHRRFKTQANQNKGSLYKSTNAGQ
jgi:KDO2-lipid IV(A) lauroyltransferase